MKPNKRKNDLRGLIFLSLKDLTAAIVLGTILFLPLYLANDIYSTVRIEYKFSQLPENDLGLKNWYESKGIKEVKIERDQDTLAIIYKKRFPEIFTSGWIFPNAGVLEELGCQDCAILKLNDEFTPSFNILAYIAPVVICSQAGFLLVGLRRRRLLKVQFDKEDFQASKISLLRKIALGIIAGIALALFGSLYDLVCRTFLGYYPDSASIWNKITDFTVQNKFPAVILGVLIAPVCEELFFRGTVLKNFAQNGQAVFGIIFSSLMFAAVHFDPPSFPVYFILGVVLALTYLKTNSLAPAIIAHAINNAVAFYLILRP